jgi:hypothetical protein
LFAVYTRKLRVDALVTICTHNLRVGTLVAVLPHELLGTLVAVFSGESWFAFIAVFSREVGVLAHSGAGAAIAWGFPTIDSITGRCLSGACVLNRVGTEVARAIALQRDQATLKALKRLLLGVAQRVGATCVVAKGGRLPRLNAALLAADHVGAGVVCQVERLSDRGLKLLSGTAQVQGEGYSTCKKKETGLSHRNPPLVL